MFFFSRTRLELLFSTKRVDGFVSCSLSFLYSDTALKCTVLYEVLSFYAVHGMSFTSASVALDHFDFIFEMNQCTFVVVVWN